ncbi:hypothetical protein ACFOOM_33775 [Streptomyces echinoruber]|uniref:Uncharacterized protein n=1 Tax=Streptomyces echinoruber TaxID=68898 RepID=A0A918RJW6_9ACTN|nr:hypothetical protein [Streptomyces echinoruber]GHA01672.1 hypothetical protein GCM10010389_46330 [Streptomyces echinoruber]
MRPQRFQDFLIDTVKNTPGTVQVRSLAEAGDSKHPFGVAVSTSDGESRWQIVGQLAEGERHEHEEQPVQGAPAAWTDAVPGDSPEGWLAAAIGRAESPEIARIDRWSVREGDTRQGITVHFHSGAKAYVRKL